VQRIEASKHITVHLETEITRLEGDRYLESVTWKDRAGREERHAIGNVFLMLERFRTRVGSKTVSISTTKASSFALDPNCL